MDFNDFSIFNRRRCESPNGFNHALSVWSMSDWFTAVLGELGEAANVAKKLNRVRDGIPGNSETPEQLKSMLEDEIADAFIYLDLLAQSQGIVLQDAVLDKFKRTSKKIGYDVCVYPACDCGYPPCQNGWPLKEGLERALVIAQEWGDSLVVRDIEDELAALPKDRPKDRPNTAMLSYAALEAAESAYWKDPPPQGAYERMRAAIAAAFATAPPAPRERSEHGTEEQDDGK